MSSRKSTSASSGKPAPKSEPRPQPIEEKRGHQPNVAPVNWNTVKRPVGTGAVAPTPKK